MPKMGKGYLPLLWIPDGAGRYAKMPVLTTTQRDALTGVAGMRIYNSTTGQPEDYDGSNWIAAGQAILDTHTAVLDAHTKDQGEVLKTGAYYSFLKAPEAYANVALTAERSYAHMIVVPRDITVDRIAIDVTTGDGGKIIRLGIYNNGTNLYPGSLLLDAGTVSAASSAVVAATISQALTKGIYWLAAISDGTPSVATGTALSGGQGLGMLSTNFRYITRSAYFKASGASGALVDPFVSGAAIWENTTYFIGLRIASLD